MITKKEVQHIAKLARLDLTPAKVNKFQKEFSVILDYFATLKEVDVSRVKPTSHLIEMENIMRTDEAKVAEVKVQKKILEQMPETKNGYLKVKSVL